MIADELPGFIDLPRAVSIAMPVLFPAYGEEVRRVRAVETVLKDEIRPLTAKAAMLNLLSALESVGINVPPEIGEAPPDLTKEERELLDSAPTLEAIRQIHRDGSLSLFFDTWDRMRGALIVGHIRSFGLFKNIGIERLPPGIWSVDWPDSGAPTQAALRERKKAEERRQLRAVGLDEPVQIINRRLAPPARRSNGIEDSKAIVASR